VIWVVAYGHPVRKRLSGRSRGALDSRSRAHVRGLVSWAISFTVAACFALLAGHAIFRPGYLLQVDTSWGPRAAPLQLGFYAAIGLTQQAAIAVFGSAAVSKAYVLSVLTLCGFAPMIALRSHALWVRVLCAAIGVFNPWTYERIVEGQWTVAAAGASLFLWFAAFEYLEASPSVTSAILAAASAALVVSFSPGFIAMLGILAAAHLMLRDRLGPRPDVASTTEPERHSRRWLRVAAVLTAIPLLAGAIQFGVSRGAESYRRVQTFGSADLKFFRSEGLPYGLPVRLLGLSGFWAERTGRFERLDAGAPWWPVVVLALAAMTFAGAWRNRERRWLFGVGVLGLSLSASTAIPLLRTIVGAAGRRIPLIFGFREPEKFSALWLVATVLLVACLLTSLLVATVLLVACWLTSLRDHTVPRRRWLAPVAAAAVAATIVLLGAARIPGGLAETLRPVAYPSSWYSTASYLSQNPVEARTAVLPWHHYLTLPFAGGRLVQNPAEVFFPGDLLTSQEPEITQDIVTDSTSDIASAAATPGRRGCQLAQALRAHGVDQVIVLPLLEGPANLRDLMRCGFSLVQGDETTSAVARAARRR
jgi:hypothetical protein